MPLFFVSLSIGPVLSALFLYSEKQSFETLQETSSTAMRRVKSAFHRKAKKDAFLAGHDNSDPYFIDKEIESLHFLESEQALLKKWLSHPAMANKDKLIRRMNFLSSADNQLSFTEENIQVSKTCKETLEKQRYPIEADSDDLKKLLHSIEETSFDQQPLVDSFVDRNRPQLLICNFSMTKKNTLLQNEVFEIKMDLLKREFLSK
jgi:hypothetical protein